MAYSGHETQKSSSLATFTENFLEKFSILTQLPDALVHLPHENQLKHVANQQIEFRRSSAARMPKRQIQCTTSFL